jgi:two-component system cell cycle sensor histidine kinase/response regulator CckA
LDVALSALRPRYKVLLGAASLFAAAAVLSPVAFVKLTFLLVSLVLVLISIFSFVGPVVFERWQQAQLKRYISLFAHDPIPVLISGPDGSVRYANPAAARSLDARKGQSIVDVIEVVVAASADLVSDVEIEISRKGHFTQKIKRVSGEVDLVVTSLSRSATAWRVLENDPAFDSPYDQIAVINLDDNDIVHEVNHAARALLGANADAVALFSQNPPLKFGEVNDLRTSDGIRPCFVFEVRASSGGRHLAIVPASGPNVRTSDAWSLLDALPVALLRLTGSGAIELSNRQARDLLGVASGDGRRLSELMEGPGRPMVDWLRDAADGRGTVQPEILQMKRKDKDVFVQVTLNPVHDSGKTVLIAVLQDATKMKSLELQFVQSQKMQAIGQLAGGVAHDFNNLLTAISGHCDLLLTRHGIDDPTYPDLMQISQNANRAAALVGQLLAFSRKQMLRPEIMNLRDMLSDVIHLLNRLVGEKVRLTLDHDPDLWAVRADKRQLEQVLMNLVVNARDSMPDGGQVILRTENLQIAEPLKRNRAVVAPGRYVVVSVEDEGVGIPEDRIDKIFEPFFTSKKQGEGTGLGLSTAYGIIKQTGGFIFVDSEPDQGSEFKIYLPAYDQIAEVPASDRKKTPMVGASKGVVMLVEDEAPVRAFACRALKMRGMSVIEASSGEEALSLLEDDDLSIDVIVTDVVMPGLDGPTWVSRARENRPDVQVIFVSGYAADTVCSGDGIPETAVFLPKPFSLTELVETVQQQISA